MKKIIKFLVVTIAVTVLFVMAAVSVSADTEGYYTYTVSNNEVTITSVSKDISGNVVIPEKLGGYTVTTIGSYAFEDCTGITGITIPASVTSIESCAFLYCENLVNVYITDLTAWCNISFQNEYSTPFYYANNLYLDNQLTSALTIPNDVTSIGNWAFSGCTSITSVTIPNSVTSIGIGTFYCCTYLADVTIPESVTEIGNDAFLFCFSLENVRINVLMNWLKINFGDSYSNPLYYADNLYLNNALITTANITSGITSIPSYALSCTSLTRVVIPSTVENISNGVFRGCTSLTSVSFSNNLKTIGDFAFEGCTSLATAKIPSGVTSIGARAFYGCTNLSTFTIESGIEYIGCDAFGGCDSLPFYENEGISYLGNTTNNYVVAVSAPISSASLTLADTTKIIYSNAFEGCGNLGSLTIPEGVINVGSYAFKDCTRLTNIVIPSTVKSIDYEAFNNCTKLKNVYISDLAAWCNIDLLYSSPFDYANNLYLNNDLVADIEIPEGVTAIKAEAFSGYTKLKSVKIPASVTSIGYQAFEDCYNLDNILYAGTEADWENVSKSLYWDYEAGSRVTNGTYTLCFDIPVEGITLNKSLMALAINNTETIRANITPENTKYKEINWESSNTDVAIVSDSGSVTALSEGTTIISATTVSGNKVAECKVVVGYEAGECSDSIVWTLSDTGVLNIIGSGEMNDLISASEATWYPNIININSVIIEDGITSIGDYTFAEMLSLSQITIPSSVSEIGDYVFDGCVLLKDVAITGNIETVGYSLFSNCTSLESVSLPNTVKIINESAFYNCTSLGEITIPADVTSIGSYAFEGCASLESITIPANVATIGNSVFYNCTSLSNIAVDAGNNTYVSVNGVLYTKALDKLVQYPLGNEGTSYTVPDSVKTIGSWAFAACTNLTDVTIYNNVTAIEEYAFSDCNNLSIHGYNATAAETYANENGIAFVSLGKVPMVVVASGEFGESLSWALGDTGVLIISGAGDMPNYTGTNTPWYKYNDKITSVVISSGVTSVGNASFYFCDKLEEVVIADSVTSIGRYAFSSCEKLASITIGSGLASIGNNAFANNPSLERIDVSESNTYYTSVDGVIFTKDLAILVIYPSGKTDSTYTVPATTAEIKMYAFGTSYNLESVIIPDSVTNIGSWAFWRSAKLTEATIGSGVNDIGTTIFEGCNKLTSITVSSSNESYASVSGVLYNADMTELICYPLQKEGTAFTVPSTVTYIKNYAFLNCGKLTSITIGENIEVIGNMVFEGCENLETINYSGTQAKWDDITKGKYWSDGLGEFTVVYNG